MTKTIITYPGTGLDVVKLICHHVLKDVKLEIVLSIKEIDAMKPDGVLLLGGADISPRFYGEPKRYVGGTDARRDAVEWTMVRRAFGDGIPVMGICRGHQWLAVAGGGSLYQDVKAQKGAAHHVGRYHALENVRHPLATHLPELHVNSLHHQAIRTMPGGFTVQATAPDGVIEAIWRPGALGVQWHPELLFPYNHAWAALFEWFVSGLRA